MIFYLKSVWPKHCTTLQIRCSWCFGHCHQCIPVSTEITLPGPAWSRQFSFYVASGIFLLYGFSLMWKTVPYQCCHEISVLFVCYLISLYVISVWLISMPFKHFTDIEWDLKYYTVCTTKKTSQPDTKNSMVPLLVKARLFLANFHKGWLNCN